MKTTSNNVIAGMLVLSVMAFPALGFAKEKDRASLLGVSGRAETDVSVSLMGKDRPPERDSERDVKKTCEKAFGHFVAPGWIAKNGEMSIDEDCVAPSGIVKKLEGKDRDDDGEDTDDHQPGVPDTTAPAIIGSVNVRTGAHEALLTWKTDEQTKSTIFWSTVTPLVLNGSGTLSFTSDVFVKDHAIRLKGLSASTTYFAVIKATDGSGNASTSATFSFTTKTKLPDVTAPLIRNIKTSVGTSTIEVSSHTNEPSKVDLYYATSLFTDVGATGVLHLSDDVFAKRHVFTLEGLSATTTYYLMLKATDEAGNTSMSAELNATTGFRKIGFVQKFTTIFLPWWKNLFLKSA